ncbi:hypothetical protein BGX38DRAFT_1307923 [Terfezia claveryi]|nr:hypothetical protein BGX38DRAFT_1307923 [Terfezia claveryi]
MSKPRGCKFFTHVRCDYNRCRGQDISGGHAKDCPFQDSEEEDQNSDVEDDEKEWRSVRGVNTNPRQPPPAYQESVPRPRILPHQQPQSPINHGFIKPPKLAQRLPTPPASWATRLAQSPSAPRKP